MPVHKKIMLNFQREYGKKKGTRIYYMWEHTHADKPLEGLTGFHRRKKR